jgi:hypothetical protein
MYRAIGLRPRLAQAAVAATIAALLIASGCGGPTGTPRPTPSPSAAAGLFVDAGADQGPISPLVYGTNTGPTLVVPFNLQPQIPVMGLKTLTFPGGNWGDENDVDDYQVDEFISFCRSLKAEPRIVVRLKGGTAQQAAALVEYVNVTQKYRVKYWGIGNEADLYSRNGLPGYTVEEYNLQWREWAEAMLRIDPTIVLIGPDVSQFTGETTGATYLQSKTEWLTSFLKANGDLVGMVSIHRYAFPNNADGTPPTIDDLRHNSREWDSIIPALRRLAQDATGKDLPLAVTEVNSSWAPNAGGEGTMDSHYNAIWWADVLGRMIRGRVTMVDQFALAGVYGIVAATGIRPMYYTYLMYKLLGTEEMRSVSDDPFVSIVAARRSDGTLTMLLVNLGWEPATKPLTVVGGSTGAARTWLFDRTHAAVEIAPTPLSGSVTLPAESVTVLALEK